MDIAEGTEVADGGSYDIVYVPSNDNSRNTWPERIIKTILFLHSGYVFLSKFGVDFTFAKKID